MEPQYQRAMQILGPMWRGIPSEYKTKYALNIWAQFENHVRSAAYTTSLAKFVSAICSKLQVSIPDRDLATFNAALQEGGDSAMLRLFRDEATFAVLLVREQNDERRAKWKERQQ